MKIISSLAGLIAVTVLTLGAIPLSAAAEDGVAVAIVYDTSGSMHDGVPDVNGKSTPKYMIANRALLAIVKQLQAFATNNAGGPARKIEAGLFIFHGKGAREAVKFGAFDPAAMEKFAKEFRSPSGNTPLGNALTTASQAVLKSPLNRKHVLVITDGMNTEGPAPEISLARLQRRTKDGHENVSVHFVAFDVDAKVFAPVKKLGATVVAAADEKQLDTQLDFVMQRKILLEEEEPKR